MKCSSASCARLLDQAIGVAVLADQAVMQVDQQQIASFQMN
jgi:hypothetical protein